MSKEHGLEVGIEEIHQVQLELMKQIANICDQQHLTYYLYWGTLIGAIRHNGFIPWDDDVDIVMLRQDYEQLISYFKTHKTELFPVCLMHYSTNNRYIYPIARVCDSRYVVQSDTEFRDYGLGIFVDIYPFDGWGNTLEDGTALFQKFHAQRRDFYYASKDFFPPNKDAKWKTLYKWVLYRRARLLGLRRIIRRWDEKAKQIPVENAVYVGNLNWARNVRERTEKENLAPTKHRFEDADFTIPMGYDRILRSYYGDYMQYPPEDERMGHHYYRVYRKPL